MTMTKVAILEKVRAMLPGANAARLAKRAALKRLLAESEAAAARDRAIVAQLRALSQREAKAVEKHQSVCSPLQERLSTIDEEISNSILDNREVDEAIAVERGKLLERIASENTKLEAEVDALKKLRRQFESQRKALVSEVGQISAIRGQLSAHGVADPQLLIERAVAQHAVDWAEKRRSEAKRELAICQENLRVQQIAREKQRYTNSRGVVIDDQPPSDHELRLEREVEEWLAEVEASEVAWQNANQHRADVRRRIQEE